MSHRIDVEALSELRAHPDSTAERCKADHEDRDREGKRDLRNRPPERFDQRSSKDTPGVDRTKGNLNDDAGGRDHPTVGCHR